MSPFTVAITIFPLLSLFFPCFDNVALIASKDAFAASALIKSCGRNIFFSSKPFPTTSSAGISFSLMMVSASVFCSSSLTVASLALSESPLMMASSSDSALFFAAGAGLDLSAVCDAFAMYAIHCLSSPINALKL